MKPKGTQDGSTINPERLSIELSNSTREQHKALQKSSYLEMSKPDADAYDKRGLRFGEIRNLLDKLRSK
jgi:hypothetical protein